MLAAGRPFLELHQASFAKILIAHLLAIISKALHGSNG